MKIKHLKYFSFVKSKYFTLLILVCNLNYLYAEEASYQYLGSSIMQSYDVGKFQGIGTNWFIQQNKQGIIFVSNANGLFSFDGEHWRRYLEGKNIRQFVITADNKIFIGAEAEFGYLEATENGEFKYHSLLPKLPPQSRIFSDINNVFLFEDKIYFISPEQIMVYTAAATIEVIKPKVKFSRGWKTGGKLFFTDGRTLNYFADNKITKINKIAGYGIKSFGFVQAIGYGKDKAYIIGSFSQGIYLWKNNSITPLVKPSNPLAAKGFYNSIKINNDIFAVATIRDGVYFFNKRAEVVYHLNNLNGLPVNITLNLFLDNQQGLWLAQEGQLVRTQLPFNLSVFSTKRYNLAKIKGLTGWGDKIYISSVNGMMTLNRKGQIKLLPNAITSAAKVLKYKNSLIFAGARECQIYKPDSNHFSTLLETASCKDIKISNKYPDYLFIITEQSVVLSHFVNNIWILPKTLIANNHIISELVEDSSGNLWTSTSTGKLIKFYFEGAWKTQTISLGKDPVQVLERKGQLLITTASGLFYWDEINNNISQKVSWFYDFFGADAIPPDFIYEDSQQRLWISSTETAGYFKLKGKRLAGWNNYPVTASGMHGLHTVYETAGITWLGFDNGIVRYVSRAGETTNVAKFSLTEVREVPYDKIISRNIGSHKITSISPGKAETQVNIFFALSNFFRSNKNNYRYRLGDLPWSPWKKQSNLTIGSLSGGKYQLQLEAKDFRNHIYRIPNTTLIILSPWYKTVWAYLFYLTALLTIIWFVSMRIAKYKTRKLLHQQRLLEQQVTERTATIQQQTNELTQLHEAKSRFFANVSHEFRTPLTLTIGPLQEILKNNAITDSTVKRHLNVALENSQQMLSLVGQILDINRLENGEMNIAITAIDLQSTLQIIIHRFEVLAQTKDIMLDLESIVDIKDFYFDEDHLNKIVNNLLSNAFKFSPPNSKIHLALSFNQSENLIQFCITDQGYGVPEEERKQLFTRFFQGKKSSNNLQPGTGIGLAMVKELLELHHANIKLDETYENGCRFIVFFRTGYSHYKMDDLLSFDTIDNTFSQPSADHHIDNTTQPQIPLLDIDDSPKENSDRPIVLIVDDNADLREFIKVTIQSRYNTFEAANGLLAIAQIKITKPDFIVSDIMMPEMDGLELTQTLKSNSETAHIPLLLLTAKATKRDTVEGLQYGADDYLSKPFDSSELIARIDAGLQQKKNISRAIYHSFIANLPSTANDAENSSFKTRFKTLIVDNISAVNYDISTMSDAMNMERTTLFRQVKKHFNCTPNQYLKSQRLKLALKMLHQQSGSISEIAYAVGFQSLNYFSRSFRDQYQVAPTNYHKISNFS